MPGKESASPLDLGPRETPPVRWNVEGMAQALEARQLDVVHERPSFGAGTRLELNGAETVMELWEHAYYVRAESPRGRVEAIGVAPIQIDQERVIFGGTHDDEVTRLWVQRGGEIGYFR